MRKQTARTGNGGFSLVELMVAMGLGLLAMVIMMQVYLSSKTGGRRVDQLSTLQQSVRVAFEYLGSDARMVGYLGCYTNRDSGFVNLSASNVATNFANGVEGYEYSNATAGSFALTSDAPPADITSASSWVANTVGTSSSIPIDIISGTGNGLKPGSDVLIVRTVAGPPVRLTAPALGSATTISIEDNGITGLCRDGTTSSISGFCQKSYALISNCSSAQVFQVSAASTTLGVTGGLSASNVYAKASSEVFPLQTVAYYVKRSSSGTSTSLYRRVFNGDTPGTGLDPGTEQELIEGVDTLQVRYGVDTTTQPDGVIDADASGNAYITANAVGDWSRVVAIRMSLLVRGSTPIEGDLTLPTSGKVDDVTVSYPTGSRFDRRVFSTTIAVRNKIAYPTP